MRPVAGAALAMFAVLAAFELTVVRAQDGPVVRVGRDDGGMLGVRRVGILAPSDATYGVHAGIDYGLLESVVHDHDLHHQLAARVAIAMRPSDWATVGVRFDGVYVKHSAADQGSDSGVLTRTRLGARVARKLSDNLRLGGELRLRIPAGQTVSDAFAGSSLDLRGLLTYIDSGGRLLVSTLLGARLDFTANAIDAPRKYSASDRAVLGVTRANAFQNGLAATYRMGAIDLLGEWSWDLYLGDDAPSPGRTPMWITVGSRYWSSDALHIDLLASISPSGRPPLAPDSPLVVIEPRFWLGVSLGFEFDRPPTRLEAGIATDESTAEAAPAVARVGSVEGVVKGPDGEVIAGAAVTYQTPAGPQQVIADAEGKYQLLSVPVGPVELTISAEGYDPFSQIVEVAEGAPVQSDVLLERPLPEGQIRGTVKDFKGRPVVASVRIKPLGKRIRTDKNGEFEIDVPPGDYTVVVTAPGFRRQTRPAKVHDNGVTVVIVDLRKKR